MRRVLAALSILLLLALAVEGVSRAWWARAASKPTEPVIEGAHVAAPLRSEPPGVAFDDDASMRAHATPVASYTMRATLDPVAHTLRGEATIQWTNASVVAQRELWVHLYLNAFATPRTLYRRTAREGFRGHTDGAPGSIDVDHFEVQGMGDLWPSRSPTTPGDPDDATDLRVPLPREVAPGEHLEITTTWTARLPAIALRTGYWDTFHMAAQWFPKIARLEQDGHWEHFPLSPFTEFYADFGTYDVTVDVPDGYLVGATGERVDQKRDGGRVRERYRQHDIHDFAFAVWDRFETLEAQEGDVAIRCLYPRGHGRSAEVEVASARFGLRHFGRAYGAYPYRTLTIVHPPDAAEEAGGMEYPTLITTGGPWFLPFTGAREIEVLTIHELGHQWFYGLVATDEHKFPFLDEGVNSYAETEAMEAWFPGASAFSGGGFDLGLPAMHRVAAVEAEGRGPVARAASEFERGADYGMLVYSRTAMTLTTLARVYGETELGRAIGRYARRGRFDHPGPAELLAAIRSVLGDQPAEQARIALFEQGSVDDRVEAVVDDGEHGAGEFAGYVEVRRDGTLQFPVDVAFYTADGLEKRVRWDDLESEKRFPYRGSSRLVAATIDPDQRVLLDHDLTNNARRVGRTSAPVRVLDAVDFAAATLLSVGAP